MMMLISSFSLVKSTATTGVALPYGFLLPTNYMQHCSKHKSIGFTIGYTALEKTRSSQSDPTIPHYSEALASKHWLPSIEGCSISVTSISWCVTDKPLMGETMKEGLDLF